MVNAKRWNARDVGTVSSFEQSFFCAPYTEYEMMQIVNKLKPKRSWGFDGVPDFVMRSVGSCIVKPLTYIINFSFETGIFPAKLKLSVVTPIFKRDDPADVSNYRPVSLLSCFHKVIELCMYDRLMKFLEHYNILSARQHGFRAKHSTTTLIHDFYNEIVAHMEKGEHPVGIFVDLSRAFDCVDRHILRDKLWNYGIRGVTNDWFESYMSGREQCVKITHEESNFLGHFYSNVSVVPTGVPQGSILGPLLFILFVNDFSEKIQAASYMYADDTSLIVSERSTALTEQKCNDILGRVNDYFATNKLVLNSKKTVYTVFHNTQYREPLQMNLSVDNRHLIETDVPKFLGVHIDGCLNWKVQCGELVKSLNRFCFQVRHLRLLLTLDQIGSFYYACVQSRLTYGLCFFGMSSAIDSVFIAQKRVVRTILGVSPTTPSKPLFKRLCILPVPCLYIFEMCVYVYKNLSSFDLVEDMHNYSTRGGGDLYVKRNRLQVTCKSPRYMGPLIYNRLPQNMKGCSTLSNFKTVLRGFLMRNMYYDVDEFLNM